MEIVLKSACGIAENGVNKLHLRGERISVSDEKAEELIALGAAEAAASEIKQEQAAEKSEAEPVVNDGEAEDLSSMTAAQLKKYAKAKGIDLGAAKLKADIIIAIEAAEKSSGEGEIL